MVLRQWVRDRVLSALLALGVLVSLWYGTGWAPRPADVLLAWIIIVGLQIGEIVLCLRVSRLPGVPTATGRFWKLIAAASMMFAIGGAAQIPIAALHPYRADAVTGTGVLATSVAAGAVFLITAMLTSPLRLSGSHERFRFWLDAATVMIAVAIFAWHFTNVEDSARASSAFTQGLVLALFGPAAFLVVVFGMVKLALGGSPPFTRRAGAVGCVAAALEAGRGLTGHLLAGDQIALLIGILANIAFLAGIRIQQIEVRTDAAVLQRRPKRPYSLLPYVSVAATYGLLIWILSGRGLSGHAWVVLGGAIASTALVVVRQLAAFADNADLLGRLDAKVHELAEAQLVLHAALDERDLLATQLRHLAFHDSLTGLPNRAMFLNGLDTALDASRHVAGQVGILVIDLDDFKPINDTFGHAAGDVLLREFASRLSSCVRGDDLVARIGGDEFAVLLHALQVGEAGRPEPEHGIDAVVARIAATMRRPLRLGDAEVSIRASIGAALEDGSCDRGALLHTADLAMYASKQRTKTERALLPESRWGQSGVVINTV